MIEKIKQIINERKNNIKELSLHNLRLGQVLAKYELYELPSVYDKTNDTSLPFYQWVNAYMIFKHIGCIPEEGINWTALCSSIIPPLDDTVLAIRYWDSLRIDIEKKSYHNESTFSDTFRKYMYKLPDSIKREVLGIPTKDEIVILHTADWHFDDNEDLPLTEKSVNHIIEYANKVKPHLVVLAGDSIHTRQNHDSPALISLFKTLQRLSEVAPIFIITGTKNHDGLNIDIINSINSDNAIKIVSEPQIIAFNGKSFDVATGDADDVYPIVLFALPPLPKVKNNNNTIIETFCNTARYYKQKGAKTILVSHGTVQEAMLSTGISAKDYEFKKEMIDKDVFDLVLLGHIHKAQQIGENIFYAGSIIRRDKSEQEDKGFYVHYPNTSEFISIPTRKIISLDFNCYPTIEMLPLIEKDADVRISYKINENETHKIDDEALKEFVLAQGAAKVKITRSIIPQHKIRAKGISKSQSLPEKIKMVADNLKIEISNEVEQKCEAIVTDSIDSIIEKYKTII